MRSPRQPGWGLVVVSAMIAAVMLCLLFRPEKDATRPRVSLNAPGTLARPRGLFVPLGAPGKTAPQGVGVPAGPPADLPREVLSGRVLSPDGSPVAGASVSLGTFVACTSLDGRFVIQRGPGRVRVSHRDYFVREADSGGAATMSLVLVPGARISGTVLDPAGHAVAGARVEFGTGEIPPATVTGKDGAYESPLLSPGPLCVLVTHPGYQPRSRVVAPRGANPRERWDVRLSPGETLSVRATSMDNDPLPDAEVWIQIFIAGESASEWLFLGRTDDLGRLETRKKPGVSATLRLSLAGFYDATATTGTATTGTATTGTATTGTATTATATTATATTATATTATATTAALTAADSHEVLVTLRPAPAVEGQAVDALSGLPVRISSIRLEVELGSGFAEVPHRGLLFQSLEPGKFVVGLPPQEGNYRLVLASRGAENAARELAGTSEPIRFDGGTTPAPIIVRLDERLELRGSVTLPEGWKTSAPPAGLAVEVLADAPPESLLDDLDDGPQRFVRVAGLFLPAPFRSSGQARTDDRGRFSFKDLVHGAYRLRVAPADDSGLAEYLSAPFAIPWEGDFPIALRRGASVSGTLHGSDGRPEPGIPVFVIRGEESARASRTDDEGKFVFHGLAPGADYRLVAASPDASPAKATETSRALAIEEGKDIAYDIWRRTATPGATVAPRPRFGSERTPGHEPGPELTEEPAPGPSPPPESTQPMPERAIAREGDLPSDPTEALAREDAAEGATSGLPMPSEVGPLEPAADDRGPTEGKATAARFRLDLLDGSTGEPFEGMAEVELSDLEGHRTWLGTARGSSFEARGLFPGSYFLRVRSGRLLVHESTLEVARDLEHSIAVEKPHPVSVKLLGKGGEPFHGEAEVVLSREGREIYRNTEVIDETVTVPTPGEGEYELAVESEDRITRMKVKVTRSEGQREGPRSLER